VVLGKLQATGFAAAESAIILMSAVDNMCADTKPVVVGWARQRLHRSALGVLEQDRPVHAWAITKD
jgi:hypothetical protein